MQFFSVSQQQLSLLPQLHQRRAHRRDARWSDVPGRQQLPGLLREQAERLVRRRGRDDGQGQAALARAESRRLRRSEDRPLRRRRAGESFDDVSVIRLLPHPGADVATATAQVSPCERGGARARGGGLPPRDPAQSSRARSSGRAEPDVEEGAGQHVAQSWSSSSSRRPDAVRVRTSYAPTGCCEGAHAPPGRACPSSRADRPRDRGSRSRMRRG